MAKIGLYSGAFNPIANHHIAIINYLLINNIVDKIVLIPVYKSLNDKKKNLVSGVDRINMCNIAIKYLNIMNVSISDYEIVNGLTNSYDIMKYYVNELFKNDDCYFIMGLDNAINVDKWNNKDEALNLLPYIIIPRNIDNHMIKDYKDEWFNKDPHIYIKDFVTINSSSSQAKNEYINSGRTELLNDDVIKYIKENGLYCTKC